MEKGMVKKVVGMEISKSQKMVKLYEGGLEVSEIAKEMGVRYNFVYNVVSNYCRMNGKEMRVVKKENKKMIIIDLIEKGKSNVEISSELRCSYNYVFGVRKVYEMEKNKK